MKVVWTLRALRDIHQIRSYLDPLNPAAARRLAEDLVLAGDSLATFSKRGRPGRVAGTRELSIVRPYVIVYRVTKVAVIVSRVWHGAQDR
jgi:toxin ParE1/3/4